MTNFFTLPGIPSDILTSQDVDHRELKVAIHGSQTPIFDAFGRIRVSDPGNRLDAEFTYDLQPDLFDPVVTNGTVTPNPTARHAEIALDAGAAGNSAALVSHPVPYTPGCSQLPEMTGVFDLAGLGTGTTECFLRSNVTGTVTEQTVPQSSWVALNNDRDWKKSHIFEVDFQSLKVGLIRYRINTFGKSTPVAQIANDNIRASGFWQQPTLPETFRLYIEDKGAGVKTYAEFAYGDELNAVGFRHVWDGAVGTATMAAICCTTKSEGGKDLDELPGFSRSVSTTTVIKDISSTTVMTPILSIRMRETFHILPNYALAFLEHFTVFTDEDVRVALIMDGTLTGAAFTDVNTLRSAMEYDTTATAITGGVEIWNDFSAGGTGSGSNASNTSSQTELKGKDPIWRRKGTSYSGIITIAAVHLGSSATVRADMSWREIR